MKTAISLPDDLFQRAEKEASRRRVSRSELYRLALVEYLSKVSDDEITARLNSLYANQESALDPALSYLQWQSIPEGKW